MKRKLYLLFLLPFTWLKAQSPEDKYIWHHVDELAIKDNASIHGFGQNGAILVELVKREKMRQIKLTFFYTREARIDSVFIPTDYFEFLQVTKDSNNLYLLMKDAPEARILSVNFQTRAHYGRNIKPGDNGLGIVTHFAVLGDIAYIASYNLTGISTPLLLVGLRDSFQKKQILSMPKISGYKEYDLRVSQEQDEIYFFHSYYVRRGNEIKTYVFKKDGTLNFSRICYRTENKDEVYAPVLKRVSDNRYVFTASIREVDTMVELRRFEISGGPVTTGFVALTLSRDSLLNKHYVHFRNFKDFPAVEYPSGIKKPKGNDYWNGTVKFERIEIMEDGKLFLHANCFIHYYTSHTTYDKKFGTSIETSHFPTLVLFGQVNVEIDSDFNILCDHSHSIKEENRMIYNRNYSPDIMGKGPYIPIKDKCSSVYPDMIYRLYLDFDMNGGLRKKKKYQIYYGEARKISCE